MRQKLYDKPNSLISTATPESLGKPLRDELQGMYRLSFGRYRIIYRVIADERGEARLIIVEVVFVGIRKHGDKRDVYRLAQKLARRGEL